MNKDIEKICLRKKTIAAGVRRAAHWLDQQLCGCAKTPLFIAVLKGSVIFFCDLVRAMKTPVQMSFMTVSSYGSGTESSGVPKITTDLSVDVAGRDVVLVEDIVDSGHTLLALKTFFEQRGVTSFRTVTLLDKPSRRKIPINADYSCFKIGDEFIVGYGLDYNEMHRTLPYIGILKKDIYRNKIKNK